MRRLRELIGSAIRARREDTGLRQVDLADLVADLGVPWTQAIVANVERGARAVQLGELLAVAIVLSCPVAELVTPRGHKLGVIALSDTAEAGVPAAVVSTLLRGRRLDDRTAHRVQIAHHKDGRADLVPLGVLLDRVDSIAGDPDARALADYLGTDLRGAFMVWNMTGNYDRISSVVDAAVEDWENEAAQRGRPISGISRRAVRSRVIGDLAAVLEDRLPNWPALLDRLRAGERIPLSELPDIPSDTGHLIGPWDKELSS